MLTFCHLYCPRKLNRSRVIRFANDGTVKLHLSQCGNIIQNGSFIRTDSKGKLLNWSYYPVKRKKSVRIVLDNTNRDTKVTAMGMTEGITLADNGDLLILFESGAQKYYNSKNPTDSIWQFTFPKG